MKKLFEKKHLDVGIFFWKSLILSFQTFLSGRNHTNLTSKQSRDEMNWGKLWKKEIKVDFHIRKNQRNLGKHFFPRSYLIHIVYYTLHIVYYTTPNEDKPGILAFISR